MPRLTADRRLRRLLGGTYEQAARPNGQTDCLHVVLVRQSQCLTAGYALLAVGEVALGRDKRLRDNA